MKQWPLMKILIPWFMLLAVTSCSTYDLAGGGIGGTGATNDYAGGGVGGTGISVGKITAAGGTSVDVNGVAFDITGATVTMDGMQGNQTALKVGMIVKINGTFNQDGTTGNASIIEFKDNLEGPVDLVDPLGTGDSISVLGQTVVVDSTTYFDDFTDSNGNGTVVVAEFMSQITSGNVVEVSGLVDANGIIHASYISRKSDLFGSDGGVIELKGTIIYDLSTGTFAIGGLTIDFSSAGLDSVAFNAANNGLYVEVKSITAPVNNVLKASGIEVEDEGHDANEGERAAVEGFVTDVTGIAPDISFVVKGNIVQVNADTIYENGTADNIKANVKVEVKGTVDANGIIVTDRIEIKSSDRGSENDPDSDSSVDGSDGDSGDPVVDESNNNSDGDSDGDSSDTDGGEDHV